jgi:Ca2+-binding RTX toxin-like protein
VTSRTDTGWFGLDIYSVERLIWIDNRSTIDNVIVLNSKYGSATGQVLDFSLDGALAGVDDISVARPTYDFELTPSPDPDDLEAARLDLVEYPEGSVQDDDLATREDRLMEPTDDFFRRSRDYEDSFSRADAIKYFAAIKYNKFGDFSGTNARDVMKDARGDSQIFAMGGNDDIDGGSGKDRIYAGKGNDIVRGGDGQDLLDGGAGYDILIGGRDIDVFVFRKGEGTTVIEDFELSFDILDVEGFNNLTYERLTLAGRQDGEDVIYELDEDTLILRNVELATMQEIDLCMK